ncbi:MAG: HlyC/CorC family transporter [Bacteriovoracaceae bacterium]|nr:HlyC/CorC family transporter [Bacteriovoracaceae bacterium]
MIFELSGEIALFIFSLALSAFFSATEAILMSIPVDRVKQLIELGGRKGRALDFMAGRSNELLTTILVWNNLVNTFAASLITSIAQRYFDNEVIAVSVGITTFFVLIFGEIIPKTFARSNAESLAVPAIRILEVFYYGSYPVVQFFKFIIETVLGKKANLRGRLVSKEDIEYLVERAEKEKTIDSKQIDLLSSILEFPTIKVRDIMVPRSNVCAVNADATFTEVMETIRSEVHSRYPVYHDTLEQTIGFLHVKDLAFVNEVERTNFKIEDHINPPFFVYEHMKIQAVFDHMNRKKVHLALVKDESGVVVGIVTLEDIMEQIFGEIQDEHDEEDNQDRSGAKNKKDGALIDAKISLHDLYNGYNVKIPSSEHYSTLSGFLLDKLGSNFPNKGNIVFWEGLSFEMTKVVDHQIIEVRIKDVDGNRRVRSKKNYQKFTKDNQINPDSSINTTNKN